MQRRVLIVARTVTTLTRLLDIRSLLDDDHRVQIVFTWNEHDRALFSAGVEEFLASLDALVLPWQQAVQTQFDLAIAASENDALDELSCPVLLVAHGIGHQKYYPRSETVSGLNPKRLRGRHLRIGLSHSSQLSHLEPATAARAVVIGDPCHDRMLASTHRIPHFRRLLNSDRCTHVVLASTWGPQSLLGSDPLLPQRFLAELPLDDYRVSLVLHPGIWSAHSPHQVRANLATALRAGLTVIPPQRGWQATILSADVVVSDCGSMPLYAAAAQIPVLFASPAADTVVPDSPLANLIATAPHLDDAPLRTQLATAIATGPMGSAATEAVEYGGKCAEILRPLLYELLDLAAPSWPAVFPPVADPTPEHQEVTAFRVSVDGLATTGHLRDDVSTVLPSADYLPGRVSPDPPAAHYVPGDVSPDPLTHPLPGAASVDLPVHPLPGAASVDLPAHQLPDAVSPVVPSAHQLSGTVPTNPPTTDLLRAVSRYPAAVPGPPLPGQHIVAHAEMATLSELEGAAIIYRDAGPDFPTWAAATTRTRPNARLVAETEPGHCRIWTAGQTTELPAPPGVDPLIMASIAYWRLVRGLPLTEVAQ
ncbi:hypothetical protein [Amycolatopsis jejuensis]|uniref:hypothetical protein n=1 Tax=Amycolatopsis jejuensis TaxID=330084 RepID=UPI000B27FCAA|nr:hypothetical protein [Amycolatopsis jejuensis]